MDFLRKRILHLSDIPGDLDSVITVDEKKEADPQRELSVSLLTTGLPLISHHILPLVNVIRTIANRTPQVAKLQPFTLSTA